MPIYEFQDKVTGEVTTKLLKISEREQFLTQNPNLEQIHTKAAGLVSGVDFNKKVDNGFKEVLSKIAEAHPNSALADKVGGRSVSRAKVS